MNAKLMWHTPEEGAEEWPYIPVDLPVQVRVVLGGRVLLEATIGPGGVSDVRTPEPEAPSPPTSGGAVRNTGTMGHVQTGSGTQFNIGRITSGKDTHIGGAHTTKHGWEE